jgi:hypothetical protein
MTRSMAKTRRTDRAGAACWKVSASSGQVVGEQDLKFRLLQPGTGEDGKIEEMTIYAMTMGADLQFESTGLGT